MKHQAIQDYKDKLRAIDFDDITSLSHGEQEIVLLAIADDIGLNTEMYKRTGVGSAHAGEMVTDGVIALFNKVKSSVEKAIKGYGNKIMANVDQQQAKALLALNDVYKNKEVIEVALGYKGETLNHLTGSKDTIVNAIKSFDTVLQNKIDKNDIKWYATNKTVVGDKEKQSYNISRGNVLVCYSDSFKDATKSITTKRVSVAEAEANIDKPFTLKSINVKLSDLEKALNTEKLKSSIKKLKEDTDKEVKMLEKEMKDVESKETLKALETRYDYLYDVLAAKVDFIARGAVDASIIITLIYSNLKK